MVSLGMMFVPDVVVSNFVHVPRVQDCTKTGSVGP